MQSGELLIRCLIKHGLLTDAPSESLWRGKDNRILQILSDEGLVNGPEACSVVAKELGIELIDLESPEVQARLDITPFTSQIKSELCWNANLIPLYEEQGVVIVAQANPFDYDSFKTVGFALSKTLRVVLAPEVQIKALLHQYFPMSKVETRIDALAAEAETDDLNISHSSVIDQTVDVEDSDAAPVIRLVNKILIDAVKMDASDIHIEPTNLGVNIRFRVDGVMEKITEVPKRLQRFLIARVKLLSAMDIAERRKTQDGRLRIGHAGKTVDMRVSCIPTASGEKLVLRLMRDNYSALTLEAIGFSSELAGKIKNVLGHDSKFLLVTGPTGSGKTTTLYTALNHLKDGSRNITTVEDPIEYRFHEINQVQVNPVAGVTFPSALRSILRQDPDIIMIGEIRDQETAHIAVQAAQTGHLVLSTLHTNSAPESIVRLLDLGVENYAIASTLGGVLAQRLVRKICEECKAPVASSAMKEHLETLERYGVPVEILKHGLGCPKCNGTGYKGRQGVYSFLEINEKIASMIQANAPMQEMLEYARSQGFIGLDEAAISLVQRGETTFAEALPYLITANETEEQLSEVPVKAVAEEVQPTAVARGAFEKGKILIIDDSEMARKFVSLALKDEFVDIMEAANGSEALELLQQELPDLILCDIIMPVMDGRQFLKKIRSTKATRDIPVLMLTAESDPDTEADLLEMGANDFVCKNSNQRVILTRIKRFVADV